MDIVIIAQYMMDLENLSGNTSRFLYIANLLKAKGHDVEIITSNFNHGDKCHFKFIDSSSFKITMLDEPGYMRNVCLKRFYSHARLAKNIGKYLSARSKPDVVYCAIPSIDVAWVASEFCEKNDVRFIVDIQDLWPESFKMVFDVPVVSDIVFYPMKRRIDKAYSRADAVVAVSSTFVDRALTVNDKCSSGTTVFLGSDLTDFDMNARRKPILDKPKDDLWLAYCGSMSTSYDLKCVINALAKIEEKGMTAPTLIAMGDGSSRGEFEDYASEKNIRYYFTGMLPYEDMCSLLCSCDMTVNPIVGKSVASIINKHGDYAASGLPVLNTQTSKEYRKLIDDYAMGFNCTPGDADELSENIIKLMYDKDLRTYMGMNSRKCAVERFDRRVTYDRIVQVILNNEEK